MDSMTAMSFPGVPGFSGSVTLEFPGPPNWLKPNVPSSPVTAALRQVSAGRIPGGQGHLGEPRGAVVSAVAGREDQGLARPG